MHGEARQLRPAAFGTHAVRVAASFRVEHVRVKASHLPELQHNKKGGQETSPSLSGGVSAAFRPIDSVESLDLIDSL